MSQQQPAEFSKDPLSELTPLVTRNLTYPLPNTTANGAATRTRPPLQSLDSVMEEPTSKPPKSFPSHAHPVKTNITPISPPQGQRQPMKVDTNASWGSPAGLPPRDNHDEHLVIFRRALGINVHRPTADQGDSLEDGRLRATGIYRAVLQQQRKKFVQHVVLRIILNTCYFVQIVLGAALTALGPAAANHAVLITVLGAGNTVIAGVLALIKGQGLPERLVKDEIEFRKVQDWIEETEALIAVGIIGRDRKEAGCLVEVAFKKYNAAKASEVNNRPDAYVSQRDDDDDDDKPKSSGSAMVRLNFRGRNKLDDVV